MKNLRTIILVALLVIVAWLFLKQRNAQQSLTDEKVLEIALTSGIKTMDPAHAEDHRSATEVANVYEGLLTYHYLKRPHALEPNLAEAMPTISQDGLVYTFKIRQGVKFHDNPCFPNGQGRELVAEDFVYSIKRTADPKVQAVCFYLIDGRIKGLNEWRKKYTDTAADYSEEVAGLRAIDKYTLQLTLTQPYPPLLYILAKHFCYAVPQEAVQHYGQEFLNHPVGTGPFILKKFSAQASKLVYHRNPTFRKKLFPAEAADEFKPLLVDAGKPLPLVDKIIAHIIPEAQPRWLSFQKGQLDYIKVAKDDFTNVLTPDQELAPDMREKGIQLSHGLSFFTSYVAFNHLHPLFKDNLKLRQAMALAYDRKTLNKLFFNDMSQIAQSIIPPGLAGYRADYVNPYNAYDLARAKTLLAEAGYPGGKGLPPLTLDTPSSTTYRQIGEHFARCMEQIGINIQVVTNPWPTLLKKTRDTKTSMLFTMAWSPGYPDAEPMLESLYGPNRAPGPNFSNFDHPEYNALYKQAISMPYSQARTALYEKLNQIAAEQVPLIYMVHKVDFVLQHSWLKNYTISVFDCYGQAQYLGVDMEKKQAMKAKL